jgi:glucose-1-phosphatase
MTVGRDDGAAARPRRDANVRAVRAVVFDLDGVIRHFDPEHVAGIERAHGIDAGSIEAFAFSSPIIHDVTTGRIRRSEWIAAIGEHLGAPAAAAAWDAQPFTADTELLTLVDELRTAGVVVAILTNGTDTVPEELARTGIDDRFDAVFNSATIGHAKPDVRAFRHVLDALGLDGPEVFFTDDSAPKLVGAEALGMPTHHFTGVARLRMALAAAGLPVASTQ